MMNLHERRRNKRAALALRGHAIVHGVSFDLETLDVSQCGALVKLAGHNVLKKRTKLLVRFDIGFMGRGVICWLQTLPHGTLYGLKFERFDHHSDLLLVAYLVKHERQGGASIQ
jgi:hypothetical protein